MLKILESVLTSLNPYFCLTANFYIYLRGNFLGRAPLRVQILYYMKFIIVRKVNNNDLCNKIMIGLTGSLYYSSFNKHEFLGTGYMQNQSNQPTNHQYAQFQVLGSAIKQIMLKGYIHVGHEKSPKKKKSCSLKLLL